MGFKFWPQVKLPTLRYKKITDRAEERCKIRPDDKSYDLLHQTTFQVPTSLNYNHTKQIAIKTMHVSRAT